MILKYEPTECFVILEPESPEDQEKIRVLRNEMVPKVGCMLLIKKNEVAALKIKVHPSCPPPVDSVESHE